jgi:hypothetical protein
VIARVEGIGLAVMKEKNEMKRWNQVFGYRLSYDGLLDLLAMTAHGLGVGRRVARSALDICLGWSRYRGDNELPCLDALCLFLQPQEGLILLIWEMHWQTGRGGLEVIDRLWMN